MDAGPSKLNPRACAVLALVALVYGGGHLLWYWGTPLGQSAVLDERENLQLAMQITTGTLPHEPFYRAMGYPLLLAGLRTTGLLAGDMPAAATALGLLLHVLNTLLVARLAQKWFGPARAGFAAGLLHGLNPVLIHYATQVLDGTFANSFLLLGLQFLPARDTVASRRDAIGLSLAWAAAALVRPQLLLVWLAFPLVWMIAAGSLRLWRAQLSQIVLALIVSAGLWFAQAAWNAHVGGEFRLLPWQGPHNLWAANKPGANGRYYAQTILLEAPANGAIENPARMESMLLYQRATGDNGPLRIDVFNRYWRDRLAAEIRADPVAWLKLELRKLYYLANNTEQYNNKTYSFHKARSPWLRFNPLGWGVLLLIGTLGLLALGRTQRSLLGAVLITAGAVAAGIVAVFVSARFRLPLTALLCALAGGALAAPRAWWPETFRARLGTGLLVLALGGLAFTRWFGAADRSTYVQDHLLLAAAAEKTGDDRITWDESRAALALRPGYPDALRLAVTSYLNLMLAEPPNATDETEWRALARQLYIQTPAPAAHALANAMGLALWRGRDPAGVQLWRARLAAQHDPESLAALCLAGVASASEVQQLISWPLAETPGSFLLMAKLRFAPAGLQAWAAAHDKPELPGALQPATENLFPMQGGAR